jgi:hypothetical protein
MIELAEVEKTFRHLVVVVVRSILLELPGTLSEKLAGRDPGAVETILGREIRKALEKLALPGTYQTNEGNRVDEKRG